VQFKEEMFVRNITSLAQDWETLPDIAAVSAVRSFRKIKRRLNERPKRHNLLQSTSKFRNSREWFTNINRLFLFNYQKFISSRSSKAFG